MDGNDDTAEQKRIKVQTANEVKHEGRIFVDRHDDGAVTITDTVSQLFPLRESLIFDVYTKQAALDAVPEDPAPT